MAPRETGVKRLQSGVVGGLRAAWTGLVVLACALWVATGPGCGAAAASERTTGPVTNLPLPRYVSLGASEINLRRGPGLDYRTDWVYRREGLPVQITDEFRHWRRIVDHESGEGWVYHSLLSGRRTAIVIAPGVLLRATPAGAAMEAPCATLAAEGELAVACAERGVIATLLACERHWCRIEADGRAGWVPKEAIWGADPDEVFGN